MASIGPSPAVCGAGPSAPEAAGRGYDGTAVSESDVRAGVGQPIVCEHGGGKEGLDDVVVDREVARLMDMFTNALSGDSPRVLLEQACLVLLTYVEECSDGFRILVKESPVGTQREGGFATIMSDVATQVEYILVREFTARGLDVGLAPIYSQALVGMVALSGQWWQDHRSPNRAEVAANLVNLAWNGLRGLEQVPPSSPGCNRLALFGRLSG